MFLSYRLKINEWLQLNNYLAFVEILCRQLCIIFIYLTPYPNGYMFCFNHLHNLKLLTPISGLVKFIFERSLCGKKSQFLSTSGFCCYLEITFHNLRYILSDNTHDMLRYLFLDFIGHRSDCDQYFVHLFIREPCSTTPVPFFEPMLCLCFL